MTSSADGLICATIGCLLLVLNKFFVRGYARVQDLLLDFDPGERGIHRRRIVAVFEILGNALLAFALI